MASSQPDHGKPGIVLKDESHLTSKNQEFIGHQSEDFFKSQAEFYPWINLDLELQRDITSVNVTMKAKKESSTKTLKKIDYNF